jgi:hypothetical protein
MLESNQIILVIIHSLQSIFAVDNIRNKIRAVTLITKNLNEILCSWWDIEAILTKITIRPPIKTNTNKKAIKPEFDNGDVKIKISIKLIRTSLRLVHKADLCIERNKNNNKTNTSLNTYLPQAYTQENKNNQTTSTKCQYHKLNSRLKWCCEVTNKLVIRILLVISIITPRQTWRPWNPVPKKKILP